MRLTEITTVEEQERVDELVGAIGRGIGKAVGGVAKGIGAVAGGIAGIPGAIKKGFKAGKSTVAGDDAEAPAAKEPKQGMFSKMQSDLKTGFQKGQNDASGNTPAEPDNTPSAPPPTATTPQPAAQPAAQTTATPQPAAQPAAQTTTTPQPTASKAEPAAEPAAEKPSQADTSLMKQLSNRVNALGVDSQRNIATYLKGIVDNREKQAAKRAPAAKPAATPEPAATTQPAADAAAEKPADAAAQDQPAGGSLSPSAFGKMAGDLAGGAQKASAEKAGTAKPAATDAAGSKLTPQQIAAKKAELKGRRASGTSTATSTGKGFSNYTKSASSQRIVGANPDGSPKIQQIKASREFRQKALQESFRPVKFKIFREQQ